MRITDLEEQLKNVEIIKDSPKKWEKVTMWATVKIEDIATKTVNLYKIVGSTESDILSETPMISNESPVWKALLWKKLWSKVKVSAPSGTFEYKILEIK